MKHIVYRSTGLFFIILCALFIFPKTSVYAQISCNYRSTESTGIEFCCYQMESPDQRTQLLVEYQCMPVEGNTSYCTGDPSGSQTGKVITDNFTSARVFQNTENNTYTACIPVRETYDVQAAYGALKQRALDTCDEDDSECIEGVFNIFGEVKIDAQPYFDNKALNPSTIIVGLQPDGSVVVKDSSLYINPEDPDVGEVVYSTFLTITTPLDISCDPDDPNSGIKTAIGCIPTDPSKFLGYTLWVAIGIAGGIAFLMLLLGALKVIVSRGNPEHIMAGKEQISSAITGLLLIIFSVFVLQLIGVDVLRIPGFLRGESGIFPGSGQ